MTTSERKFREGDRVRLKDEPAENLYRRAFVGSEGVVKNTKRDQYGFPLIYIEWDKDFWNYNGEDDMWTYEGHFDLVEKRKSMAEDKKAKKDDDLAEALIVFLQNWKDGSSSTDDPSLDLDLVDDDYDEDPNRTYAETVAAFMEAASGAEAFMGVAVERRPLGSNPDHFTLIPHVFSHYQSDESGVLLETQLAQILALTYQELAGAYLTILRRQAREQE